MTYLSIRTTFEQYDNAIETRTWMTKFIREHNGIPSSAAQKLVTKSITTHKDITKWVRILRDGVVVGYSRLTQPYTNATHTVVSDIYILKKYRGNGLFHMVMPDLLTWSGASAVTLTKEKFDEHYEFYEQMGLTFAMTMSSDPNLIRPMTPDMCLEVTLSNMEGDVETDLANMSPRLAALVREKLSETA